MTDNVAAAAAAIQTAFETYHREFRGVARRSWGRFERRDWRGAQEDAAERLGLYRYAVDAAVRRVERVFGAVWRDENLWTSIKDRYAGLIAGRPDAELAATFFNSVTRRILTTVGANSGREFIGAVIDALEPPRADPAYVRHPVVDLRTTVRAILHDVGFKAPFRDQDGDAALVAGAIDRRAQELGGLEAVTVIEMLPSPFFRNKGAYLVGRFRAGPHVVPLALALLHGERGVEVDAALMTSDELSVVFGFTRSYFHVEGGRPRAMVEFLQSLMPLKRVDELYTSLGYNKHGKTELYRGLLEYLDRSDAKFELAEGAKGLVMTVFALPSFGIVFKIIKDRFGDPKTITRQAVKEKYDLVFVRDRVGRLADAQEFEHLEFPRARFSDDVLAELLREAPCSVEVAGDRVILQHVYTERLVTPLNLYLRKAGGAAARDAIIDYGNAIKDLAAANIFTGDMLLKNFGVTRHGRVIFYDYDELCLVTDCCFRALPAARTLEDELSAEPWFAIGERDVFPEEFRPLLVLPGHLGEAFLDVHADLLDVGFWQAVQMRQNAGEVLDVFPYRRERRLRAEKGDRGQQG